MIRIQPQNKQFAYLYKPCKIPNSKFDSKGALEAHTEKINGLEDLFMISLWMWLTISSFMRLKINARDRLNCPAGSLTNQIYSYQEEAVTVWGEEICPTITLGHELLTVFKYQAKPRDYQDG